MDATQRIENSLIEEENDDDEEKERKERKESEPLAALKVFKNNYIPETEIPLYLGENVLGRDPAFCSGLLQAPSVSGRHAVISISVFPPHDRCHGDVKATETLLWDLGSLNGSRRGRFKLTPHVRYALSDGDSVVLADLPCQYVGRESMTRLAGPAMPDGGAVGEKTAYKGSDPVDGTGGGVENGVGGSSSPPAPVGNTELKKCDQTPPKTLQRPGSTVVSVSDSDSEEDEGRQRGRRFLSSASSDRSGPTCSTLLTPANKVIPDSEDESFIPPPSAMAGGSIKIDASSDSTPAPLNFNMDSDTEGEEEETDVMKAQPEAEAIVVALQARPVHDDSDAGVEEGEKEKATGEPEASSRTTPQDLITPASVSMDTHTEENHPAPQPVDFHMDSDTDAEDDVADSFRGSELDTSVTRPPPDHESAIPKASESSMETAKTAMRVIKMDSDSDTDDEDPFKSRQGKATQAPVTKTAQPHSDSDTDLDDDPTQAKTPAVTAVPPQCVQTELGAVTPHAGPVLAQPPGERGWDDFRMDSDTDVEEEEEKTEERGRTSTQGAAQIIKSSTPRGAGPCLPSLLCPSPSAEGCSVDTEDFAVAETQSFVSNAPPVSATLDETPASFRTPVTRPSHGGSTFCPGLSDSGHRQPEHEKHAEALGLTENDLDLQDTQAYAPPQCVQTELGAVTPHAGPVLAQPPGERGWDDFRMDSDTDVEEEEEKTEERGRTSTQGAAQIIKSSTPRGAGGTGLSEEEVETQAFLGPSQTFRRPALPSPLCSSPSAVASTMEIYDFAVAETQSFASNASPCDSTLEETPASLRTPGTRPSHGGSSFCLGLSISSHRQPESEEHAKASGLPENDWDLQATQSYGGGEAGVGEEQKQLHQESTQAYTVGLDQEEEPKEEEEETQPLDTPGLSHPSAAETRLVTRTREEDGGGSAANRASVTGGGPGVVEEEKEEEEKEGVLVDSHLSTAETLLLVRSPKPEERLQPYDLHRTTSLEEEEEDGREEEEEAQRRKARSTGSPCRGRLVDEEQSRPTKPDAVTHITIAETQPVCEEEEQEEEQWAEPRSSRRPRRGRQTAAVEPTQALEPDTNIHDATVETMGEDEEVHEEEPRSSRRPRRGRRVEMEPTQLIEPDTMSAVEMQPMSEEEIQVEAANVPSLRGRNRGRGRGTFGRERRRGCSEREGEGKRGKTLEEGSSKEVDTGRRGRRSTRQRERAEHELERHEGERKEKEEIEQKRREEERERKEKERMEKEREETRLEREKEREEKERLKKEKEREEKERLEKEKKEREEKERLEKEREEKERLEKEKKEREEKERLEKEKKEREEKERLEKEREEKERLEKEKKEREEKERLEKEKEREEKERLEKEKEREEKERLEKEKKEREEKERLEKEKKEREEKERLEKEKKEREEKERLEKEKKEREEKERLEKVKKEREEKERLEKEKKEREEKERLEKEKKEREEKERLEKEKKEREEKERLEKEKKEREEKERLEKEQKENEVENLEREEGEEKLEKDRKKRKQKEKIQIESERREREKERLDKKREREEFQQKSENEKQEETDRLGRKRRKREEKEQLEAQELERQQTDSKKREKEMELEKQKRRPQRQRKTVLGKKELEKEGNQELSEGILHVDDAQITTQEKESEQGEAGKQECEDLESKHQEEEPGKGEVKARRGRCPTRKSVVPPAGLESLTPSNHSEGVTAKRTRSRSNSSNSEHFTSINEHQTQGQGRKTTKADSDNIRSSVKRRTVTVSSCGLDDTLQDSSTLSQTNSRTSERSRSSVANQSRGRGRGRGRGRKSAKVEQPEEEDPVGSEWGRDGPNPPVADTKAGTSDKAHQEKKESGDLSVTEADVPSKASSRGRKRGSDSTTGTAGAPHKTPKSPRHSVAGQTHKVLFTGVVDEDGEKVVQQLGGVLAKGVADMTHLVTDKVRRTVKFLCAVARGVPVVTPDWLAKSAKSGSFLSPNEYLVKDKEQEKKFNFSLQEALRVARQQPLLQGYEIHVTTSVRPEPPQMREIITCCGARYLPKMPSVPKAQMVVVSCEEDRALFERALGLSVPVVSAEFLLTGILQQRVDLQTHAFSASPASPPKPSSRGRKK
ncbi:mediator of DNA damage checkpoint protein 1 isoform X4 [Brachyhypopomus gauderio]